MDLVHRDPHSFLLGIAEASCGDQRKCYGPDSVLLRQCQALPVTGPQKFFFPAASIYKQGTNCVDDIFCRKIKPRRNKSFSLLNETYVFLPVSEQLIIAGCLIDSAVTSRPDFRILICRVDNSIRFHLCYVIAYDLKRHGCSSSSKFLSLSTHHMTHPLTT